MQANHPETLKKISLKDNEQNICITEYGLVCDDTKIPWGCLSEPCRLSYWVVQPTKTISSQLTAVIQGADSSLFLQGPLTDESQ